MQTQTSSKSHKRKTIPVVRTCGHTTDVIDTGPTSTEWSIRTHYKLTPCVPCKKALARQESK